MGRFNLKWRSKNTVEVAKEVAKPDYLSLVNKSGSGFNVSELVVAIVGSEIEPKRNLHKTKQEKT